MDDYAALNKQAFRVPFDILTRFWPPRKDAEYFKTAFPVFSVTYTDTLKDNPMGQEILLAVWKWLETVAEREAADDNNGQISFETIVTPTAK